MLCHIVSFVVLKYFLVYNEKGQWKRFACTFKVILFFLIYIYIGLAVITLHIMLLVIYLAVFTQDTKLLVIYMAVFTQDTTFLVIYMAVCALH